MFSQYLINVYIKCHNHENLTVFEHFCFLDAFLIVIIWFYFTVFHLIIFPITNFLFALVKHVA